MWYRKKINAVLHWSGMPLKTYIQWTGCQHVAHLFPVVKRVSTKCSWCKVKTLKVVSLLDDTHTQINKKIWYLKIMPFNLVLIYYAYFFSMSFQKWSSVIQWSKCRTYNRKAASLSHILYSGRIIQQVQIIYSLVPDLIL